jgi:hypothetical protein
MRCRRTSEEAEFMLQVIELVAHSSACGGTLGMFCGASLAAAGIALTKRRRARLPNHVMRLAPLSRASRVCVHR